VDLPNYKTFSKPCVHTVQQLYSLGDEYLRCISLLQLELSITDTAVVTVIATIKTQRSPSLQKIGETQDG